MDKELILAVAGSGKSRLLIERLDLEERFLILTYTENNWRNLRNRICRKFGFLPSNIRLEKYFTFLHTSCYRPYLLLKMRSTGISFRTPSDASRRFTWDDDERYLDSGRRIYHCRMAKLLDAKGCMQELRERISRYYDVVFVDEVQDFDGYDFDFLLSLSAAPVGFKLVGDFYQHTFPTSKDGNKNSGLYDDFDEYAGKFEAAGLTVNRDALSASHRCAPAICDFIRKNLGIDIRTVSERAAAVHVIETEAEAERLFKCKKTVKLFYKEHEHYDCFSENWGASKGLDDFEDVCVVLTQDAHRHLGKGTLSQLSWLTRNKLYVACSRARGDLFLVPPALFKRYFNKPASAARAKVATRSAKRKPTRKKK